MNQLQYRLDQEILKTNQAILALAEQGGGIVWQDYIMLISSIVAVVIAIVVPFYIFKRQRLFEIKMLELQKNEADKASIIRLIHHISSICVNMYSPLYKIAYVSSESDRGRQIKILEDNSKLLAEFIIEIDNLRAELQIIFNHNLDVWNIYKEFYERYKLTISKAIDFYGKAKQSENLNIIIGEYNFEDEVIEVKKSVEKLTNKLNEEFKKIN